MGKVIQEDEQCFLWPSYVSSVLKLACEAVYLHLLNVFTINRRRSNCLPKCLLSLFSFPVEQKLFCMRDGLLVHVKPDC